MSNFIKVTGGDYPLFRVALSVTVLEDLVQLQVTSVFPTSDNWAILSFCRPEEVIVKDPGGMTELTIGAVTLTYQSGIFIGNNVAVTPTRLGERVGEWSEVYAEAVAFLIDALDIECDAEATV